MPKSQVIEVKTLLSHEIIERKIYLIRGKKVMFDRELAALYGVSTGYLNRQVKRHMDHFPADFMFQLNKNEFKNLICQFGTSRWGGTRKRPSAFTDYGILMLSSVLHSKRAVQVNIQIMRTFARLRELLASHKDLQKKIDEMERNTTLNFKWCLKPSRKYLLPQENPGVRLGSMRRNNQEDFSACGLEMTECFRA